MTDKNNATEPEEIEPRPVLLGSDRARIYDALDLMWEQEGVAWEGGVWPESACCSTCGFSDMENAGFENYVFWHTQLDMRAFGGVAPDGVGMHGHEFPDGLDGDTLVRELSLMTGGTGADMAIRYLEDAGFDVKRHEDAPGLLEIRKREV